MSWFLLALLLVAVLAGATAAVVGFGIGSLLTPLLAGRLGMPLAIAVVAIPHAVATALRCWRLRHAIDWGVMRGFGLVSALGALGGAFFYTRLGSWALTLVLGALLLLTAVASLAGVTARWRPRGPAAFLLGATSGIFGGLAGNQGGLRAVALGTFALAPIAFVATATAIGFVVDGMRMPLYVWRAGAALAELAIPVTVATVGVVAGTLIGERMLLGISPEKFRRVTAAAIGALGGWLILNPG